LEQGALSNGPLTHLREIQFSLVKDYPQDPDTTHWIAEATHWLQRLQNHHRIEKVTISWFLTLPRGATPDEQIYECRRWREYEKLLDTLPALSSAQMHLDAIVCVDATDSVTGEFDIIASENCAKGLRTVWKHPRCSVSAIAIIAVTSSTITSTNITGVSMKRAHFIRRLVGSRGRASTSLAD